MHVVMQPRKGESCSSTRTQICLILVTSLCWLFYQQPSVHTYTCQLCSLLRSCPHVGGFFRELWYLARFLIIAFFVTTLISSALFSQMKGGGELDWFLTCYTALVIWAAVYMCKCQDTVASRLSEPQLSKPLIIQTPELSAVTRGVQIIKGPLYMYIIVKLYLLACTVLHENDFTC